MTWFGYKKYGSSITYYPYVRRTIKKFTPKDNIPIGTWLSIDISGLDLDKKYDSSLNKVTDESSYIVVYETPYEDMNYLAIPTECVINNDILYFKTIETHAANIETLNRYTIYCKTPNIRYINPITIDNSIYYEDQSSQEGSQTTFDTDFVDVDITSYEVTLNSGSYYNFSFVNLNTDWNNGLSNFPSSKVYLTFSGPTLEIYGDKGPDFGQGRIRITSLADEATPIAISEIEWDLIDCYSNEPQENVVLYSCQTLPSKECMAELVVSSQRNVLSSGNSFKINSYEFAYNAYLELNKEELFDQIAFVNVSQYSSAGQSLTSGLSSGSIGPTGPTGPAGTGSNVTVSEFKPTSAKEGDLWFQANSGKLLVYYDNYWVDVSGS